MQPGTTLPSRCVVKIVKSIDDMDDLINCLRVNRQWRRIVERLLKNVKYLVKKAPDELAGNIPENELPVARKMNTVYYTSASIFAYWHLNTLLPNMTILDLAGPSKLWLTHDDAEAILGVSDSLRGIIYRLGDILDFYVMEGYPHLLMLSIYYLSPNEARYFSDVKLLQLHTHECFLDSMFSHSLNRLHIGYTLGGTYDGVYLDNLRVLEINTYVDTEDGRYNGFSLINRCPNLISLYIKLEGINNRFYFDDADVAFNKNVRDFVFESPNCEWRLIKKILKKYPRIKHLAIRDNCLLQDNCIPHIIRYLPDVVLIDVRGCANLTQDAEDYVSNLRGAGNFPTFYFRSDNRILFEWHDFSTVYERITKGISFMKYCFIKSFDRLPYLMDPYR